MPISENETAISRGRIPTYMRRSLIDFLSVILGSNARCRRISNLLLQNCSLVSSLSAIMHLHRSRSRQRELLQQLLMAMYNHYSSYDMFLRPTVLFPDPPFDDPVEAFTSYQFYQNTGFWPDQFMEVKNNLTLIPDVIRCQQSRCRSSKSLSLFLLLRRWNKADTWEDVSRFMRRGRVWCITVYRLIFRLVAQHYRRCVQVIDYRRILPLLSNRSDEIVWHSVCDQDVLFFTDGKPWKMARPGRGQAAEVLRRAVGGGDVNLVQQAYYNGHYGFCGGKVQHVLQADGMCYSFVCPLRRHDAMVLHSSSMVNMLSVLFVDGDPARPAKTVTDKAYGRTRHFRPLHTDLELRLLNPADRASAIEEDEKNKGPRMAVEVSFNNIVRKFTHNDYFATHRILQQGRSNWPYLRCLWDLQVLFYNLFSCAQGHGNPCNAILGVVPPTVSEYLYSANHNLLIPIPRVEEEDDNFGDEEEAQRMYYHIF